jgi:pyridoxamine 5'-phosphate oxidase
MSEYLEELRREYISAGLNESDLCHDPLEQFKKWFSEVINLKIDLANAMVVATADGPGKPSARYVLLKDYDENGFVFYTNSLSRKGMEIQERPSVALLFYWKELNRQIRIEGIAHVLDSENADKYFSSRPRGSQLSAWVANQSEVIPDQAFMHRRIGEINNEYNGLDVNRPPSWLGYQVVPDLYEFWQGQENRLHDRLVYRKIDSNHWEIFRLAP